MATTRTKLAAGNWKMYGSGASASEVEALAARIAGAGRLGCDVMICPPATLLRGFAARFAGAGILWGAQDCHPDPEGAHTGDISAEMLAESGARAVIVGHSERRRDHGETDALVRAKAEAAHRAGLSAIICIGETEAERDSGRTLEVIARQARQSVPQHCSAANTILAYEPVWAIGTGRTPNAAQIEEVHRRVRAILTEDHAEGEAMRILYGGSVKPGNAAEIFGVPEVDGALVGGASLKAADFWGIISACPAVS
jgi:triosephosphate isomerase